MEGEGYDFKGEGYDFGDSPAPPVEAEQTLENAGENPTVSTTGMMQRLPS